LVSRGVPALSTSRAANVATDGTVTKVFGKALHSAPADDDENYDDEDGKEGDSDPAAEASASLDAQAVASAPHSIGPNAFMSIDSDLCHLQQVPIPRAATFDVLEPVMFAPPPTVMDPLPVSRDNGSIPSLVRQPLSSQQECGMQATPVDMSAPLDGTPVPFNLPHVPLQRPPMGDKNNRSDHTSSERVSVHALLS
jgi:hypothetical protein